MFIGREKELVLLQQDYIGKAVMVYGKRRVGKTTLIQKALDNCPYQTVYFECLKGTVQENIDSLVDELVRAKILPVALSFSTLQDVFTYLNTLPQKMVVVIDEYPYLKVMNEPTTVDSVFQSIIDNRLGNIELILSGSHIGMMKDLLQEKNALYGRFAVTIKLNELNYLDVAPTLTDFISRRFEGICRDYFSLQVRSGKLKGVRNIGSYYYDDPVHRKNGEFDVALELADGYAIYEAKYYAQPMTLDEIHREAQQVANIKELAVKQLGFIAINGFVEQEKPYTYLDGNDIFAGM